MGKVVRDLQVYYADKRRRKSEEANNFMDKMISFCIACYNEVGNVEELVRRIYAVMETETYQYEIVFADNASTDGTQDVLRRLASKDKRIKVILNARNYGPCLSPKNALHHCVGDAVISLAADLQDPPELIPRFLRSWEEGYKLVYGQKMASEEGHVKHALRSLYYSIINAFSSVPQYKHISGICLNDQEVLRELLSADPDAEFRNLIAELGYPVKLVPYKQNKRKSGKSSYSIGKYFDFALNTLVLTSTAPLRLATVIGCVMSFLCFGVGLVYLILKLIYWEQFSVGMAPLLIGMFFLGSAQLLFVGLVGEYVGVILKKVTKQLPVIEKEKINFEEEV